MLACNETATLIRHHRTGDEDSYSCHVITGVSWFEKSGAPLATVGEKPAATVTVRIPEALVPDPLPAVGDYMVKGAVDACPDRKALNAMTGFRIAFTGDNRRLRRLRHVVVKSA